MSSLKYSKSYKQRGAYGDLYTRKGVKQQPIKYRKNYAKRFRGGGSSLKQELKFLDNAVSFTVDATNEIPATGQLCAIAQGDGQSNRDGRKVIIKSILVTGRAQLNPAAATTGTALSYVWLVQDTQANGAVATVADDNTGIFTTAGANASLAVRCLANSDRFKILKKWIIEQNSTAGVSAAYNVVNTPINYYMKCHIPVEYDASAATGAIGTIRSNNVFLVSGTSGPSDDQVDITATVRLRFIG